MSANEGSGNPNGTSTYFNNGSAEGNGAAGFFDHNQTPVNQWGLPPADQNSAPGGFPQTSQHLQQQYQQPQQAPQFYNPTEFQKTAAGQEPEIFNPYSGGNSYQSQQPFPQDGFQQQPNDYNQQPNDYNQQQFNQNDHGESVPQQQQQNPEADQGQMPYQHGWQGYGAPADAGYGQPAPGSQPEGQVGHWQNQDNHTGQQANDSYSTDQYAHPGYGYGADMSASPNNLQEIGHSENLAQKLEQDDMSGNSGFGAFFNDDGSDFVISSDKGSAQISANVSERTSPDASAHDPNSQSQTNEHVELQDSAKSEVDQTNSNIEPFQPSPLSSGHIPTSGHDQTSENNLASGGEMQDRTTELSLSNQDSQNVAPLSSTFGSSRDLGSATNATSDYGSFERLQSEPFVANQTSDESNVHVQPSVPNSDMGPVENEVSPAGSLVSTHAEMPLSSDGAEVVHQLLSVPVSSLAPQSSQQDSESFVKPLPPPISQEESMSSLRSDGDELPNRVDGPENAATCIHVAPTNSGPPSTQDPNVSQTDATIISTAQPLPQQHQQPQHKQPQHKQPLLNPNQPDLTSPSNSPSLSTQSSLETNKSSELEDSGKKRSDSLSSGSHPSAFRQVRGLHGHRDISVNPSPPLWQAEVPALPGNILLAPALNISTNINPLVPTNTLSAPSLSTPRQLADSVASVSVPPVPSFAASLLSGTNNPHPQLQVGNSNHPSATTSAPTAVQQVTQSVSKLDINKTAPNMSVVAPMSSVPGVQVSRQQPMPILNPNPVAYVHPVSLSQPHPVQPTTQQQNVVQPQISQAHPATSMHGMQPSNPSVPTQGFGVASTPQQQPQQSSGNVPNQQQQTNMNNPPPMQQQDVIPGQQGLTATQPQQPLQQDYQQQQPNPQQQQPLQQQQLPQGPQSQQPGYNQYPPGQQGGQWYPNPANRQQQQPYPQGYYQGGAYEQQGYRGYGYGSPYARQGPYSRQDPYYQQGYGQQTQRTPQRTAAEGQQWERPQSRQGERPQSRQGSERPSSRQGWPDDQQEYDARYQRTRRDPRYYGGTGVDEYGRPYDRRYYEYYRRKQQQSGQYRDREYQKYYEQQRNRSGSQQNSQDASSLTASDASLTEKKDDNSQNESFLEEFHHQGGGTPEQYGTNQSAIYPSGYENQDPRWRRDQGHYDNMNASDKATYDSSQYYNQDYSWQQEEQQTSVTPPPPERRTPVKHSLPHVIARFSPGGQLIKVLPNVPSDNMPAQVEIHNVEMMIEHCDEITEYKAYPGPLIKGETHKNDVLHFAAGQATECRKSTDLSDKESAALLWDLLVLLCRQNGTVVETDISDILLKEHPMTSRESTTLQEGKEEGEATQEGADISGLLSELPKSNDAQDMVKQTHRFRELLLFGRKKEALDWAMKKCLWGHALLLASKMDNRTHASVMTRFANSLPMNDPLQTLYQLMSDRQPAAVTSCNDEKWGDWRPHLAMVMSNLSSSADVGFKSVVTLGDSLSSRGLLHAAQFCYLMAQIGFGIFSKKTTKIVLLGSSHNLPFNKFSTNSAIQLTEIYEYAQMLANKHFLIPNFQAYKFIYACRLADFGFTSQALRYCETIANTIQCSANYYNSTLVSQVCQLSHRLKHHDPEFHDMREITEPQWIVPLEQILIQINEGQLKPPSSSGTPMPWVESSSNLSTLGVESTDGTVQSMGEGVSAYHYDGQGGYQQDQQVGGQGYEGQDDQQQVNQYQDQQTDQQQEVPYYDYNQQQQLQQLQQQQQPDGTQPTSQQQYQQQNHQYENYQPYNTQPISTKFAPNQDPGASMDSNFSEYSTTTNPSETEGESTTEFEQSGGSQFDFNSYNQMQQQQQQSRSRTNTLGSMAGPPSPQKTLTPPDSPNSYTASRHRTRTTSGGSTASAVSQRGGQQKQAEPKETKPQNKPKPKSSQGGWLRWFNKKLGGSNIHLPDDTKKTIEWDPVKKQWINKAEDADEVDNAPPPPPPSDKEISGYAPPSFTPTMQPAGSTPGLGGGLGSAAAPPPMGANKFSRKFGAGNYVDVLNKGKGTSSLAKTGGDTSSLFQTLPAPANAAPVNFFIPDSSASEDTQTSNQEGDAQVGNPGSRPHSPHHEQGTGQQSENLSRSSSMSDLSTEVSQHMAHQPTAQPPPSWQQETGNTAQQHQQQQHHQQQQPQQQPQQQQQQQQQPPQQQPPQQPQQPAQPAGVPMFYNPQQFNNTAGAAGATPGGFGQGGGSAAGQPKRGYGQPRQYPKQT